MDADEIVIHEVNCDGVSVVLDLLENALVNRVDLRIDMRIVRLARSA